MINITIDTDGAAFEGPEDGMHDWLSQEVIRILTTADFYSGQMLQDINGNTVGEVTVT